MGKVIVTNQSCGLSALWIMGWIFTIGYLKLSFGRGVLAIIIWPYYLGVKLNSSKEEIKQ